MPGVLELQLGANALKPVSADDPAATRPPKGGKSIGFALSVDQLKAVTATLRATERRAAPSRGGEKTRSPQLTSPTRVVTEARGRLRRTPGKAGRPGAAVGAALASAADKENARQARPRVPRGPSLKRSSGELPHGPARAQEGRPSRLSPRRADAGRWRATTRRVVDDMVDARSDAEGEGDGDRAGPALSPPRVAPSLLPP